MIEKILKAKHWLIFTIIIGIPFIGNPMFMHTIGMSDNPLIGVLVFPIIFVLSIVGVYSWVWSVAIGLQKYVPSEVKLKVNRFKVFFMIPLVYILLIVITVLFAVFSEDFNPMIFLAVVPLHLFSIFCMFHNIYFVAKTLRTVELQRQIRSDNYIGELFLVWFLPIGIWFIQPRINRIVEEREPPVL